MKYLAILCLAIGVSAVPRAQAETAREKKEIANGDPDFLLWKWANFVVLFGVVAYYGVKLGTPYFKTQTETINKGLDEARQRRAEADRRSLEVQRKLANLGAEIEQFRKVALDEQGAAAARMADTLQAEIARVHTSASQQIESIAKHERLELRRHASTLALQLAEQRLRLTMNPDIQDLLTRQFVKGLGRR